MSTEHEVLKSPGQQSVIAVTLHESPQRESLRHPHPRREASHWISGEPSLQDILHDPLIHAVLKRDGLSLRDLMQAVALGRSRLALQAAAPEAASDAA